MVTPPIRSLQPPFTTRREPLEAQYGIRTTSDNLAAAQQADVVVLAVKPQLMAEVCKPLQAVDFSGKLVISIAAGVSVKDSMRCWPPSSI